MKKAIFISILGNICLLFVYTRYFYNIDDQQLLIKTTNTCNELTHLFDNSIKYLTIAPYILKETRKLGYERVLLAYHQLDSIIDATMLEINATNNNIDSTQSYLNAAMFGIYAGMLNDSIIDKYYPININEKQRMLEHISKRINEVPRALSNQTPTNLLVAQTNLSIKQKEYKVVEQFLYILYTREGCGFAKYHPVVLKTTPDFPKKNDTVKIWMGMQSEANDYREYRYSDFTLRVNGQKIKPIYDGFYYKYATKTNKIGLQKLDVHFEYKEDGTQQSIKNSYTYLVQ
jgi:hypothetical protein